MSLPRYPEYKDSGVEWLGQVPATWSLRRLGYHFSERREKVSDKDFAPLSVTKNGVVPQLETAAKTDDGDNRKLVRAGDFVINGRSDRKGSSGMAELDGSVSLINTVLSPKAEMSGHYAHHLLRSVLFQEEYYRFGKGIVADLWSTSYSEMRNITLAVPKHDEQEAIAAFLDREMARIDALIAEQETLLALLAEKRQATISHAVTRGLDPNVPMKDSGIAWLGAVPAHWDVLPFKRLIASIEQGWSPQCENYPVQTQDEWGVLKVGCVNRGVFSASENKKLPAELEPIEEYSLKKDDLLISRANTRDLVGSAAVVPKDHANLLLCDKLYRLRVIREKLDPWFASAFLGTPQARSQIELQATGASSSMLNIGQSTILELQLPIAPLEEQAKIRMHIAHEELHLNAMQVAARRAIQLLSERRSALISAAVTGQIDVRGLASEEAA